MKKIVVKIAKTSSKSTKSTKCFLGFTSKDLLRYSISSFITGVVFFIIGIVFSAHDETVFLEIISAVFMAIAILSFPYISREHKDNLGKYILYFLGYLLLVIVSVYFLLSFIVIIQGGKINVSLGIISSVLMFLTLNFTIKPFIAIISFIFKKIKQASDNTNNKTWAYFKNILANITIITSFIISILTIILNLLEIVLKNIELVSK